MRPAPFDYVAPESLAEALALLAAHGEGAKVLAGGQSLVPLLNMRLARPRVLISLRRISTLAYIRPDNGWLRLGSMTRQHAVEESPLIQAACPLLADAIRFVGHPAIRSRGTVGGSIAHADPAAEIPAVLVALGGQVRLASQRGERTVEASEFFRGLLATAAGPDELVTEVVVAGPEAGVRRGHGFEELSRREGDFALAGVAVALTLDADDRVSGARIALLGVEDRPRRRTRAEQALHGTRCPAGGLPEIGALAAEGVEALDDLHASAAFRTHLVRVLTQRAVERAYRAARHAEGR